jgi:hypothetical protein
MILFTIIIIYNFSLFVCAEDDFYELSILNKSCDLVETDIAKDIYYYNISIVLANNGTIDSDDITVVIQDEDQINISRNGTISAGSNMIFIFEKHPLLGDEDHLINISYGPTNNYTPKTTFNSGRDSIKIFGEENKNNSVPGFEILTIIALIVICAIIKK